jgi:glycosyltransferase involved in cell wall biosynthesis
MSDKVKLDLLSYLPEAKFLYIPHPVYDHFGDKCSKLEALKKMNLERFVDKKIVLFFGIIRDYKGLDILLEAFALMDDSFHLIVAGEVYGSFEKYDAIISDHQLKDKVSLFNNYIGDEEVKFFFSAAAVGVLPYKSATQSGITSIANHFELPLIATNVGGLAETILHKKTGLIVDKVAPDALADALVTFFNSNQQESFQSAIRQINTENTWEKFGVKLLDFYRQLK